MILLSQMISVEDIVNEYKETDMTLDIEDFIHECIDYYISHQTESDNKKDIHKMYNSTFQAMKAYECEYGKESLDMDDEERFYAQLAYHTNNENLDLDEIKKMILN